MSPEININIILDSEPVIIPQLQNQALLKTILETQAKILGELENRDSEDVVDELYKMLHAELKDIIEAHEKKFPESYRE